LNREEVFSGGDPSIAAVRVLLESDLRRRSTGVFAKQLNEQVKSKIWESVPRPILYSNSARKEAAAFKVANCDRFSPQAVDYQP